MSAIEKLRKLADSTEDIDACAFDMAMMKLGRSVLAVVEAQAAEIAAWKDFNAVGGKINEVILLNATMDTHKALAALRALEGGE